MRILLVIVVAAASAFAFSQITPESGDWPVYGHDPAGTRHSPLAQINSSNISHLQRAWTYHTGEKSRSFEATPDLRRQRSRPTNFSTLRMSRTAWKDEVEDMKDKGAIGTDDDFNKIIDYLAKNFPPRQ